MCVFPFVTKNQDTVPCGRCPLCRKRRATAWAVRLQQEYKRCNSAVFLTLTYDTDHVPITKKGFLNLSKRDLQLFFKRLRYAQSGSKKSAIKYYACGEYGGKSWRPHYHVILFNANIELLSTCWDSGNIHYGTVTEASIAYTLKYISKPHRIPLHKNDDRQKEFSLMSKNLGSNYLSPAMVNWHHATVGRSYYPATDGKKLALPRYYKDKIYSVVQRATEYEHYIGSLPVIVVADHRAHYLAHRANVKALLSQAEFLTLQKNKI